MYIFLLITVAFISVVNLYTKQGVFERIQQTISQKSYFQTPPPTKLPNSRDTTVATPIPNQPIDTEPWGVARQIDEVTWTMKLGQDPAMATPQEIYQALNEYRQVKGASDLSWDERLANYAQSRADFFMQNGNTDKHAGFIDFTEKQEGFNKLGFNRLGENASFGSRLSGTHVIEWMYAADPYHDANQLNSVWTHVGVGVKGTATALIFGR